MSIRHAIGHGSPPWAAPGGGAVAALPVRTGRANIQTISPFTAIPPDMVFASAFDTELGQTTEALTDGNKWPGATGFPNNNIGSGLLDVRSAGSEGIEWPSANLVWTGSDGDTNAELFKRDNFGEPAVGESVYVRWYVHVIYPDGQGFQEIHPIEEITFPNWAWQCRYDSVAPAGQWENFWLFNGLPVGKRFFGDNLLKNTTYRIEFRMHRTTSTLFQPHARVFRRDVGGVEVQVQGDVDFVRNDGSGQTLADLVDVPYTSHATLAGSIEGGINGWDTAGVFGAFYQGCFAVRTLDWCGQYNAAEAALGG